MPLQARAGAIEGGTPFRPRAARGRLDVEEPPGAWGSSTIGRRVTMRRGAPRDRRDGISELWGETRRRSIVRDRFSAEVLLGLLDLGQ